MTFSCSVFIIYNFHSLVQIKSSQMKSHTVWQTIGDSQKASKQIVELCLEI